MKHILSLIKYWSSGLGDQSSKILVPTDYRFLYDSVEGIIGWLCIQFWPFSNGSRSCTENIELAVDLVLQKASNDAVRATRSHYIILYSLVLMIAKFTISIIFWIKGYGMCTGLLNSSYIMMILQNSCTPALIWMQFCIWIISYYESSSHTCLPNTTWSELFHSNSVNSLVNQKATWKVQVLWLLITTILGTKRMKEKEKTLQ